MAEKGMSYFENELICGFYDIIENTICEIKNDWDWSPENPRHKAIIRDELTERFNGCFPYYTGDDSEPCYKGKCDYGCEHCPMKDGVNVVECNPKSKELNEMVRALIKSIKVDANYEPTETEIKDAIDIIFTGWTEKGESNE